MRLSPHPAQARPPGLLAPQPPIRSVTGGSSAGPFTTPTEIVAASNLSLGSGVIVSFSWWAHLTTSARFRAGATGPVSGQLCATISWRGRPSCRGFLLAFGRRHLASWSSCSRRGVGLSLRSAYRHARGRIGPRRGFRVSHARATVGVGALSTPGTTVLLLTAVALRPASVASQRRVPAPRSSIPSCEALLDEASTKGSSDFTRPIFPSPVAAGWNGSVLGFPPSFAPGPYGPRTSGWGQVIEHGPESTLYVFID
jgi:hypothetical protein